jgi:hypothetical protein
MQRPSLHINLVTLLHEYPHNSGIENCHFVTVWMHLYCKWDKGPTSLLVCVKLMSFADIIPNMFCLTIRLVIPMKVL